MTGGEFLSMPFLSQQQKKKAYQEKSGSPISDERKVSFYGGVKNFEKFIKKLIDSEKIVRIFLRPAKV